MKVGLGAGWFWTCTTCGRPTVAVATAAGLVPETVPCRAPRAHETPCGGLAGPDPGDVPPGLPEAEHELWMPPRELWPQMRGGDIGWVSGGGLLLRWRHPPRNHARRHIRMARAMYALAVDEHEGEILVTASTEPDGAGRCGVLHTVPVEEWWTKTVAFGADR